MHPTDYSHVLFLVHMPDTGLWRWSYMEREHLWRNACDEPPRFSKSVATVGHSAHQHTALFTLLFNHFCPTHQAGDVKRAMGQVPARK
jgi:hypothetical protein